MLADTAGALDEAGIGFSIGDADEPGFPLVYVNDAFVELTGFSRAESLGRSCSFLRDGESDEAALDTVRETLARGLPGQVVLRNRRRDGSHFWNELRLLAPRAFDGRRYVAAIQADVTASHEEVAALRSERDRVAVALAAAARGTEALEDELRELRALRDALTPPTATKIDFLEVATAFEPAEAGVAGDFFLVAEGPQGAAVVAVGDVVGHGLTAATRASFVRQSLATFAAFTDDPARLLTLANSSLIERGGVGVEFVTAVCVTIRPDGDVRLATAGHPVPVRLDGGGEIAAPRVGLPLGLELDLGVETSLLRLEAGDGLLLFTDGLPEARCPGGPRLGGAAVAETPGGVGLAAGGRGRRTPLRAGRLLRGITPGRRPLPRRAAPRLSTAGRRPPDPEVNSCGARRMRSRPTGRPRRQARALHPPASSAPRWRRPASGRSRRSDRGR